MSTSTKKKDAVGTGFEYKDFQHDAYQESDAVKAAKDALNLQTANKPGAYQSQWQTQLDDAMNKILNREKFSYDLNGDALYQQYKDKYIQQGKMAMADTIGQASAMTGGYGNSYAASVGNQAYQQSLQQLNDVVPELYQMAYDRYNTEGQELYNQYAMLGDRENMDYSRYRDSVNDWQAERDYLTGRYDNERNLDYSKYTDDRNFAYGQYSDDRAYAYNDYRDKIADAQWESTFDEGVRQYNEQFAYQKDRDAVADKQWNDSFQYQKDRDVIADQQWQADFDEAVRQYNTSLADSRQRFDQEQNLARQQLKASTSKTTTTTQNKQLTASEYNEVMQNAASYAQEGKSSLASYLNGLVNRGYISADEAADILLQYFPMQTSNTTPKGGTGNGAQVHLMN